jgi:hypothetical protein
LNFLAIAKLPFPGVRAAHAADTQAFRAERDEHHDHDTVGETPYGDQPVTSARNDHGSLEEPFQIGEIKATVFGDIGEALRFIPNDLRGL